MLSVHPALSFSYARHSVIALVVCLFFATAAQARIQFPELTARVVDNAHVLTPAQRQSLEQKLAQHEQQSSDQLVVVSVESLQGYDVADFALRLGRHWGIGQKDVNNGVVFLIAPSDKKVTIQVGYGLEGTLSDAVAHRIIQDTVLPYFKDGNMAQGIIAGTDQLLHFLSTPDSDSSLRATQKLDVGKDIDVGAILFYVIFFIFSIGSVGSWLKKIPLYVIAGMSVVCGTIAFFVSMSVLVALATLAISFMCLIAFRSSVGSIGGYSGGGYRGGGGFGGGFGGGGGSFGGGGASGGW